MSNQQFLGLSSNESVSLYRSCIERIFHGLEENENEVIIYDSDYLGVIRKLLLSDKYITAAVEYDYAHVNSVLNSNGKEVTPDVGYALTEITNNILNYFDGYSFEDGDLEQSIQLFIREIDKFECLVFQIGECLFTDEQDSDSRLFDFYYALLVLLVGIRVISLKASKQSLKAETKSIIKSFDRVLDDKDNYILHSFGILVPQGEIPIINRRLDRLPFINEEEEAEVVKKSDALDLQQSSLQVLCRGLLRFLARKDTFGIILEEGYDCAVLSVQAANLTLLITLNTILHSSSNPLYFYINKYHRINTKIQVLVFDPSNWEEESGNKTCFQKKKASGDYSGVYFESSYYSYLKSLGLPYSEFFIRRLCDSIQKHSISTTNIGMLALQHKEELVRDLAVSSNHFIGSLYDVEDVIMNNPLLTTLLSSHFYIEKDTIKQTIYKDISERATKNLSILHINDLCIQLFTSEWLYKNLGSMSGLDNTFICAGYFKLVEKLLSYILLQDYSGEAYGFFHTTHGATLQITEDNERFFMLGNMVKFFKEAKGSPLSEYKYSSEVIEAFEQWVQRIRNGYFHKDLLPAGEVSAIRNKTLEILYYILGLFPKR